MSGPAAAVVVRWRGGEEAAACLAALLAHGGTALAEVVLVDSGSGDDGGATLAARFPAVRLLALPENRGFAHAANCGAAATSAPLLLLVNPDLELAPGALETLAAHLGEHPDAAGAVPLLSYPDGRPQHRWQLRRLPGVARLAVGLPGAPAFAAPPRDPSPVPQPAAACWLLRRSVWDALGGLDEAFAPAWWEDVDLCARLAAGLAAGTLPTATGFTVVPAAAAVHASGSSVAALGDAAFLAAYHRNLVRYAHRHHPRGAGLIRLAVRAGLGARALLRPARAEAFRAAIRALADPPPTHPVKS